MADGLRISFHAWHEDTTSDHAIEVGAFVAGTPSAAPPVGLGDKPLQTEIVHTCLTPDWVPNNYHWPTTSGPTRFLTKILIGTIRHPFSILTGRRRSSLRSKSRPVERRAQDLQSWKEMVVFHNVPILRGVGSDGKPFSIFNVGKARSAVTPCGIRVTLPTQGRATVPGDSPYSQPLLFRVLLTSQSPLLLPKSPLCQRYRKPMTACLAPSLPGLWGEYDPATGDAIIEDYGDGNPAA